MTDKNMDVAASSAVSQIATESTTLSSFASMLGGLILVLLVIFALTYLVKRLKLTPATQGVLKILASCPLGQKERVILVQLGEQQYLLGVTSEQVTLIDKIADPVQIDQVSFASMLKQARKT